MLFFLLFIHIGDHYVSHQPPYQLVLLPENNFSAPGADRFKFELKLIKKTLDDTDDKSFVELLRINDGETEKAEQKTRYNIIRDYFAQRTYEESGDYSVVPFTLTMDECLNDEQGNDGVYERDQTTRDQPVFA